MALVNLKQISELLSVMGIVADTKIGYSAFRNLVRCPIITTPDGKKRPCVIEEEDAQCGTEENCQSIHFERIEQSDGRAVLNYLEGLFERLQNNELVRSQYEFSDFLTWCDGNYKVLNNLESFLGSIYERKMRKLKLPKERRGMGPRIANKERQLA